MGSSGKQAKLLEAVTRGLGDVADVEPWTTTFNPVDREHAEARVADALAAGGRVVDDSAAPEGWILADPAGNRVCVAAWPDGAQR